MQNFIFENTVKSCFCVLAKCSLPCWQSIFSKHWSGSSLMSYSSSETCPAEAANKVPSQDAIVEYSSALWLLDSALGKDWCMQHVPCKGIKLFKVFFSDRPCIWSYKECIIISIRGSRWDESSILLLMPHQSVNCLPLFFNVKITDDVIWVKFTDLVFAS